MLLHLGSWKPEDNFRIIRLRSRKLLNQQRKSGKRRRCLQRITSGKNVLDRRAAQRSEPTWHTCKDGRERITEREKTQREVGQVTAGPGCALSNVTVAWESGVVGGYKTHSYIKLSRVLKVQPTCRSQKNALSDLCLHFELQNGAL